MKSFLDRFRRKEGEDDLSPGSGAAVSVVGVSVGCGVGVVGCGVGWVALGVLGVLGAGTVGGATHGGWGIHDGWLA